MLKTFLNPRKSRKGVNRRTRKKRKNIAKDEMVNPSDNLTSNNIMRMGQRQQFRDRDCQTGLRKDHRHQSPLHTGSLEKAHSNNI